jgi:hypothetical protein
MHDASLRVYRRLLKLYPAVFREEYASELERQVRDDLAESSGFLAVMGLWGRLLLDLAVSVPAQFAREAWRDGRHALRRWARHPLNTAFAILALAIGIGANIGVFSVVNALLLRPLPFCDPERLAQLAIFSTPIPARASFTVGASIAPTLKMPRWCSRVTLTWIPLVNQFVPKSPNLRGISFRFWECSRCSGGLSRRAKTQRERTASR